VTTAIERGVVSDLRGKQFGRLTVLDRAPNGKWGSACWRVRCECGQERIVRGSNLRSGNTRSCGCLDAEVTVARLTTHGASSTPEYQALVAARYRCTNPSTRSYADYGGRGIEYRLPADYGEAVALLIETIGPRPDGMSLDRIDNDGHYEPGNLRWATASDQRRNQRESPYERGIFSSREAARYLRRRRATVVDLARAGAIAGCWRTEAGHWRIPRTALDSYLAAERAAAERAGRAY
jgi:excisionase family DNA binding protein